MGHERIGEVFNFGVLHLEWPTALFIFVVFIITMILLNFLLFRPIIRTIENRENIGDKNQDTILNLNAAINAAKETYHSKLNKTQQEIQASYKEAVAQATKEAGKIITQANAEAEHKLNLAANGLQKEKEDAINAAKELIPTLANAIQDKTFS